MQVILRKNGTRLMAQVEGRIDTNTAADFGTKINDALDDITDLMIDFAGVTYVSSIGLRVILELQKRMDEQGSMKITNMQSAVREVFEMTGFDGMLNIE